jgi:hypothetical protein
LPTQGSHRPVRARIRAYGSSGYGFATCLSRTLSWRNRPGDCFANAAIRFCFVDTLTEFRCIRRVSQKRFHNSTSRFPPLAPTGGCSPASSVLSRRYDALLPSRRASFPSLGGTSVPLVGFAPKRTSEPPGPGVGNPVSPPGNSPRSEQGSPKFLGNLDCPFAHVPIRRRQDCLHQTIQCSSVALGDRKAKAPTRGLSTLNSMAFGLAVYAS